MQRLYNHIKKRKYASYRSRLAYLPKCTKERKVIISIAENESHFGGQSKTRGRNQINRERSKSV